MVCSKCRADNARGASVCRKCGAKLAGIKTPPSTITVSLPKKEYPKKEYQKKVHNANDYFEEDTRRAGIPGGVIAAVIAVAVLVVAAAVVIVFMLGSQEANAGPEPELTPAAEPTPAPTPEQTSEQTPEQTDDLDIIFEMPQEGLLPDPQ